MEKLMTIIIPNLIGLCFMIGGWFISILNVGLTRFQPNVLFTKWTLFGLILILIGAYIPVVWSKMRGKE